MVKWIRLSSSLAGDLRSDLSLVKYLFSLTVPIERLENHTSFTLYICTYMLE